MLSEDKLFSELSQEDLWKHYCGFMDLSVDEFQAIQDKLLLKQVNLVANSTLGKKIMNNTTPASVEEFRNTVPLTTYSDYEAFLKDKDESALAVTPGFWTHSSGRSGAFKWIPQSKEKIQHIVKYTISLFILASTRERGQVNIAPGVRFLSVVAPIPYPSGWTYKFLQEQFTINIIPNPKEVETVPFAERMNLGFQEASKSGVDIIGALGSILVKMGENISSKGMLPKDMWPTKAIMTSGMDAVIYRNAIEHYWGTQPHEIYGCSEAMFLAMDSWTRNGIVFVPDVVFLEFVPVEEIEKGIEQPKTLLMGELEEGKTYELVLTQLYGMPFLRYRMGDLLTVTKLEDTDSGIKLPHFAFQRRVGEVITLAGLCQLDEKTIWRAITNTGVKFNEWVAHKIYDGDKTWLSILLEYDGDKPEDELVAQIDEELKKVDTDYRDLDFYLDQKPVKLTRLAQGTFARYYENRKAAGADPAHLKPQHINPDEAAINLLTELGEA